LKLERQRVRQIETVAHATSRKRSRPVLEGGTGRHPALSLLVAVSSYPAKRLSQQNSPMRE